jgi:hypothetical protein
LRNGLTWVSIGIPRIFGEAKPDAGIAIIIS